MASDDEDTRTRVRKLESRNERGEVYLTVRVALHVTDCQQLPEYRKYSINIKTWIGYTADDEGFKLTGGNLSRTGAVDFAEMASQFIGRGNTIRTEVCDMIASI